MVTVENKGFEFSLPSSYGDSAISSVAPSNKDEKHFRKATTVFSSASSSERKFPTIEENEGIGVNNNEPTLPSISRTGLNDVNFEVIIFEQGLKAGAILYLSLSVIATVAFFSRQIVAPTVQSDKTWSWIGILRAVISLSATMIAVWYKVLLHNNAHYLERVKPENRAIFYTFVVISATISWIYLILSMLENVILFNTGCALWSDVLVPVTQMFFIIVTVMSISDMIFYQIKTNAPLKFYVIYKTTAVMVFTNCINCLVFDAFLLESIALQNFLSHDSTDIFCYKKKVDDNSISIFYSIGPYLQMFVVIFFVSSIAILIKPMRQFPDIYFTNAKECVPLPPIDDSRRVPLEQLPEYNLPAIIMGIFFCIASVIGVIVDANSPAIMNKELRQIVFNVIPLCTNMITIYFSFYFLKLLHRHFPVDHERDKSITDSFIVWLSLFGQLTANFKGIINCSQYLEDTTYTQTQCVASHRVYIVTLLVVIIQSMLQAMVLNYITNIKTTYFIHQDVFKKLSCGALIMIANNVGLCVTNWYLLSGYSTFTSFPSDYNQIGWDILSTISDPFTLLFRWYCVLFLLRFISKLRCTND